MTVIRSIFFNITFYVWTGFWTLITLFTLPFPFRYGYYPQDIWSKGIQKFLWMAGLKVEIRGRENIPETPALFASKHQSAWDTTIFFKTVPKVAVVLKKELLGIPVFGWYLRKMEQIPIDRSAGAGALKKMIRFAKKAVGGNRSVLIFPEGTRIPVDKTGTYHPGVYALYSMLDLPAVPVALNSGLFWPRRKFTKNPGTIIIEFLPQIPTGLGKEAFLKRLENDIETATKKLVVEARKK